MKTRVSLSASRVGSRHACCAALFASCSVERRRCSSSASTNATGMGGLAEERSRRARALCERAVAVCVALARSSRSAAALAWRADAFGETPLALAAVCRDAPVREGRCLNVG